MTTRWSTGSLAVSLGSRLAGAGPEVSAAEAAATVVAELRDGAERSTAYVRDYTGLDAGALTAPVLVVDRPGVDPGERRRLRPDPHAGDRRR